MKKIKISSGKIVLVDDSDYQMVRRFRWRIQTTDGCSYAVRNSRVGEATPRRLIRMHRMILGMNDSRNHIDHVNGNGLDNQRKNLRLASPSQNGGNRRLNKNNTSGIKGVSWDKSTHKWLSQIEVNQRNINLGRFTDLASADQAYQNAARKYFGEFFRLK